MFNRTLAKFNDVMESLVDSVRLRLLGPHLLGDIPRIPLPCTLDEALDAYGEPNEQSQDDRLPDTQIYSFEVHDRPPRRNLGLEIKGTPDSVYLSARQWCAGFANCI